MSDKKTAVIFKALGDENRIRIVKLLCGGEKCACMLQEVLAPETLRAGCSCNEK